MLLKELYHIANQKSFLNHHVKVPTIFILKMNFLKNSALASFIILSAITVTLFITAKLNPIFTSEQLTIWEFRIWQTNILKISTNEDPTVNTSGIDDPVLRAIEKYKSNSCIKLIKTNDKKKIVSFRFQEIQAFETEKELKGFGCSKDLEKQSFANVLVNRCSQKVRNFHRKTTVLECLFNKTNYRPVSILPNQSRVFERRFHKQLSAYSDSILSKQQYGFRKSFNAQFLITTWKIEIKFRPRLSVWCFINWSFKGIRSPFPQTIATKIKSLWSRCLSSSFYIWLFHCSKTKS